MSRNNTQRAKKIRLREDAITNLMAIKPHQTIYVILRGRVRWDSLNNNFSLHYVANGQLLDITLDVAHLLGKPYKLTQNNERYLSTTCNRHELIDQLNRSLNNLPQIVSGKFDYMLRESGKIAD